MLQGIYRNYFSTAGSVLASDLRADLRADLWADGGQAQPGYSGADGTSVLLEQYKIYVEMADRVSARRGLTNTFFLSLNSAIFAAIGFAVGHIAHPAS